MSRAKISFPAYSYRSPKTPFGRNPGYRSHFTVVEIQDLPDFSNWRRINVRDPKLSGALSSEIQESLLANLETFVFLNRGIVLAVESVRFKKAGTSQEED